MTIFAVNNGAMASLVDKPMEIKKKVLSLHVLMDYYTVQSFHNLPSAQSIRINTLFQVTDNPSGQLGFVNVTNGNSISVVAAAGSDQATVVRDVSNYKTNYISVVQISNLLLPSELTASSSNPGKSRSATPVKAPSSSIAAAPKLGDAPAQSPTAAAPAPHSSARASTNSLLTIIFLSALSLTSVMLI
ncbi:fasciclin-like arabinogalactan protein 14 [Pyrus communis]|uniref:fasciclin-like arabinogalactan protein 14 n=1 Tax=Pyrus communis TaxID=23211 RepID=UPI0035C07DEA